MESKHYYLFDGGKVGVSGTEKPVREKFTSEHISDSDLKDMFEYEIKHWQSYLEYYPIADKENEEKFNNLIHIEWMNGSSDLTYGEFKNKVLESGILLPSVNVEVKTIKSRIVHAMTKTGNKGFATLKTVAVFKESKQEETQDELFEAFYAAANVHGISYAKSKFTITRK